MFFTVLYWYFALFLVGLFGFIFVSKVFSGFEDKGYGLAKIFGLLLISYIFWIFDIKLNTFILWSVLLILTGVGVALFYKTLKNFDKKVFKLVLAEEIIFLILFIIMILFRGAIPQIEGIEKFMDFAIINGLLRAQTLPPQDVWFSGTPINYYYFGHYLMAVLFKLTNIVPAISYNLGVATIFALSGIASFSITFHLTKKHILGIFGAGLLVFAGNLDLLYKQVVLQHPYYFYAEARSLIEFTVNEFPSYSFLIGDLHAHILGVPLVLLTIALLLNYMLEIDPSILRMTKLFLALALGALVVTNTWDFLIYTPLYLLFAFIKKKKLKWVCSELWPVLIALLAFFPFYFYFKPANYGISVFYKPFSIIALFSMFGYFALIIVPYLILFIKQKPLKTNLKAVFVVSISIMALLLIILPQFTSLNDIYYVYNPPYFRANTIFKLWYQAWILLAISTPFCVHYLYKLKLAPTPKIIAVLIFVYFTFYIFKYPVVSAKYILGSTYDYKGLNGTSYLHEGYIDELALIEWINSNIKGQPVLLEADGESYTMGSLISSYTGLPTVVGWSSHELGWRGNWDTIAKRMGDIEKIYTSTSLDEISTLLKKYDIQYVAYTYKENTKYGDISGKLLLDLATPVFTQGNVQLLKVN